MHSPEAELKSEPSSSARLGRVLAVLTDIERQHFFPGAMLDELRSLAEVLVVSNPTDRGFDLAAQLKETAPDALIACWKTPPLPPQLPESLAYVCYLCGSVRKLATRSHLERGLLLSNWGGSISRIVAEWALFHMIAGLRRATFWTIAMHQQGAWKNEKTETASLFGRSVGFHGFGRIARELVRLLAPFGCSLSAFAPDVDGETERTLGVRAAPSLEKLFADSDVVVELAPLIPETEGIINEGLLRLLKPGAVFVNVGRGAVVDEDALVRVAREGKVQFGLDVFIEEPLPPAHPLRGLTNVLLTPHLAGPTTDRRRDAGAFALKNLRAFATGASMQAIVTPEAYDVST